MQLASTKIHRLLSKLMNKTLFFIFILCASLSPAIGAWETKSYEATIPLFAGEKYLGDLKVEVNGDDIVTIERESLKKVLDPILKDDTLEAIDKLPPRIGPNNLPFPIKLNSQDFRIETVLGLDIRASEETQIKEDLNELNKDAIAPSPFGGAINYRLEQTYGDDHLGGNSFNGQFNSFLNMNTIVFENQTFYQTLNNQNWQRGDTRFVKDFERHEIRTQVGDVYPQIQGFMIGRPLGGVNVHRNFSLNPYRLPYPTGTQNFTIKTRSLIKYFVNGTLIKTEYLAPGNYTAKDIPLNNGLNTIMVEATDDLGQKQVFVFRSAASINLLNKGEDRFDLSYGVPFLDNNAQRNYVYGDGKVFSGFYQYGLSSELSASVYSQNQLSYNLLGSEVIYATALGNFNVGHAESIQEGPNGQGNSLSYQYVSQGQKWYQSHSLIMRYENRSDFFKNSLLDLASAVQNNYAANYTLPLSNLMTFSAGVNYGDVRNNTLSDRRGFDTTINLRVLDYHNLSLFIARTRDENKVWNDVAFLFLTISIPEKNAFVSSLYDQQQKNSRLTYLKDNQNRLYNTRAQGTLENGPNQQFGEMDIVMPTPIADWGGRVQANSPRGDDHTYGKGSLSMNSAFVFAYDQKKWGRGLSRPVSGSFVIFKPENNLKGQRVALKSTSPYTESESGLFDEIVFSNLLAYQYRDIQLDPTMLTDGYSLVKEKFTLYPTFRSAHLITLKERGAVMLRGQLLDKNGKPLVLQVGHLGDKVFFTNRKGYFFVEGVDPGNYDLTLEGYDEKTPVHLNKDDRGLKNIGPIQLKETP